MAGVDQERKLERRGKFCFIDEHDKLIDVISSLNEVFFSVPQPKVIEDKWKAIMFTSLDEASK